MWKHFQTLRFKLATTYLVVFGAILTALGGIILAICERDLRREFDSGLRDRAASMAERIVIRKPPEESEEVSSEHGLRTPEDLIWHAWRYVHDRMYPPQPPKREPTTTLNQFRFPGHYFQLRLPDGTVFERSQSLGRETLPFTAAAQASKATGEPIIETIRGEAAKALIGTETGELRQLTRYHARSDTEPFYFQMAVNAGRINESVRELRRIFQTIIPAGLIVAAAASWLLAKRSTKPIARIADIAERLGAHNLSLRFDTPQSKDEVGAMVTTINEMLDRFSAAFQAQERFMADVSHELKTPLSVLLGEAQVLMQRDRTPEEYVRFVRSVQDEARALAQTVDSVLTLAHAEAGIPPSQTTDVPLNEAIMEAVERCRPQAVQRGARLVPQLAMPRMDQPEAIVAGDAELLCLMFVNVIRNAIRYSPEGEAIDIQASIEGTEARIAVRDRGPGIPPQFIDRVFERFFRVPQDDGAFTGAGVGLTIVRGVAQLHGGSVRAVNQPDAGCEFILRLPLRWRPATENK